MSILIYPKFSRILCSIIFKTTRSCVYSSNTVHETCKGKTSHIHKNRLQWSNANMSVITSSPGQLQVITRICDVAAFGAEKISVAIGNAFLAVEGQQSADSRRIHDRIEQ